MCRIKGLSFVADGERYAADVSLVQKIARKMDVTPVPAMPDEVAGIANMKGMVVTVLGVAALLGRKAAAPPAPSAANVVVFKSSACGGDLMGLLVDSPGGLIEIDEEKITPLSPAEEAEGEARLPVAGVFESGGTLYRILSIDSIISRFRDGDRAASGPRGGSADEDKV